MPTLIVGGKTRGNISLLGAIVTFEHFFLGLEEISFDSLKA